MTQWHEKSNRKESGGIRHSVNRASRYLSHKGGEFSETTMSEETVVKVMKGRGTTTKTKLRKAHSVSVTDPKTGKTTTMTMIWVHDNPANRLYSRRNIVTKGTLIELEGNGSKVFARVTNRPGQDGNVSAMLADAPAEKKAAPRAAKPVKTEKAPAKKKAEDKK